MATKQTISNFGGNVRFSPSDVARPENEQQLAAFLEGNASNRVRVVASRHSWSEAIKTDGLLVDMSHFRSVEVFEEAGEQFARVGAGIQIKHLLIELNKLGLTTPSVGLITEQTIAGASATGTHGSGKHSLSHYIRELRVMSLNNEGEAVTHDITDGVDLRAARCSLGCLGVVTQITIPVVPQYWVTEKATRCKTVTEVIALEESSPLQQFFLLPHQWLFLAQERRVADRNRASMSAWLYRIYWFVCLDVSLHLVIKLFAAVFRSRWLIRLLYKHLLGWLVFPWWVVTDRSEKMLTMEHELFRHLEMELFVPRSHVERASRFVIEVLKIADGESSELSSEFQRDIEQLGLMDELDSLQRGYTHHYPICFRRILPDDTLISMAAGTELGTGDAKADENDTKNEDCYSISFITYVEPRDPFFAVMQFLANSMSKMFGARPHWGKWNPLALEDSERLYPQLSEFRSICAKYDPNCVFSNDYTRDVLGVGDD